MEDSKAQTEKELNIKLSIAAYKELEKRAEADRRTVELETQWLLEDMLKNKEKK